MADTPSPVAIHRLDEVGMQSQSPLCSPRAPSMCLVSDLAEEEIDRLRDVLVEMVPSSARVTA